MKGYIAAFSTYEVIAGIGLILVLVFAPNINPENDFQSRNASFLEMREGESIDSRIRMMEEDKGQTRRGGAG